MFQLGWNHRLEKKIKMIFGGWQLGSGCFLVLSIGFENFSSLECSCMLLLGPLHAVYLDKHPSQDSNQDQDDDIFFRFGEHYKPSWLYIINSRYDLKYAALLHTQTVSMTPSNQILHRLRWCNLNGIDRH